MQPGASDFVMTRRGLTTDRLHGRGWLLVLIVGGLVFAWAWWFFNARVPVVIESLTARVEVAQASHPIETPIEGRVVASHIQLGMPVVEGQLLIELDTQEEHLHLAEVSTRIAALQSELTAIRHEVAVSTQAQQVSDQVGRVAQAQTSKQSKGAVALAENAELEAERIRRLHEMGAIPEAEALRKGTEAVSRRAQADSLTLSIERSQLQRRADVLKHSIRVGELKSDITRLEGEMETLQARASRLQHAIDLRRIRSPVAGRVAEMSQLPVGTVVPRGFRLADVVPEGRLRVVAFFSPPVALGRLRVGQAARMRLDGFPWVQYGTLKARVERLASELRDGRVRVELSLQPDPDSPIPLQHGLPGVVEVEVERTSPATLALRAAGRIIRRTAYSGAESDSFRDGKAGS